MRTREGIVNTIKTYIRSQTVFTDANNRKQLEMASCRKIIDLKEKWENGSSASLSDKTKKIKVLKILERLKLQSDRLSQALEKLNAPYARLTVYEVLILMFSVVSNSMYHPEWITGSGKKFPTGSKTKKNPVK